jgi:hypothetical protein
MAKPHSNNKASNLALQQTLSLFFNHLDMDQSRYQTEILTRMLWEATKLDNILKDSIQVLLIIWIKIVN